MEPYHSLPASAWILVLSIFGSKKVHEVINNADPFGEIGFVKDLFAEDSDNILALVLAKKEDGVAELKIIGVVDGNEVVFYSMPQALSYAESKGKIKMSERLRDRINYLLLQQPK